MNLRHLWAGKGGGETDGQSAAPLSSGFTQHHLSSKVVLGLPRHHFSTGSHGSNLVPSKKGGAGFTIFELVVILAITPILAVLALNIFNDYQANYQLLLTAEEMRSTLAEARVLAMIGEGGARHGIAVVAAQGTYTLFRGPSYARRDPSFDRVYQWEYQYITYSGPQEIVFSRLKGTTTPASIMLTNTAQKQEIITVNDAGVIQ